MKGRESIVSGDKMKVKYSYSIKVFANIDVYFSLINQQYFRGTRL